MHSARKHLAAPFFVLLAALLALLGGPPAEGAAPNANVPIRISAASTVPACVTPERLNQFLLAANPGLDPRFRTIAYWYKRHGEAWRVRWDYAFFQMALETNFLSFRRGDGRMGDVDPRQNNFAGLGTTGDGRPGDSFPDVPTGVLAQIQHLVVYSGERVQNPVAPRTQLKQDDILAAIERIAARGPVTFQDLTRRWAADRRYDRSIESIAMRYRQQYCERREPPPEVATRAWGPVTTRSGPLPPAPAAAVRPPPAADPGEQLAALARAAAEAPPAARKATPGTSAARCSVRAASYGGRKTLLIQAVAAGEEQFTVLGVLEGFERSMAEGFIRSYAPGGRPIGEFPTPGAALARAFELCPSAATPAR